jgi:hypothetical protein
MNYITKNIQWKHLVLVGSVLLIGLFGCGPESGDVAAFTTLRDKLEKDLEGTHKLDQDYDLAGETIEPIKSFKGTFDGNGHTIKNFVIKSDADDVGLFATLAAEGKISNLTIADAKVEGKANVGVLAGQSSATLSQITIQGGTVTGTGAQVGGIVGVMNAGSITDSTASSAVTGMDKIGGLVGEVKTGTISKSSATKSVLYKPAKEGDVLANGIGGLVGVILAGKITDSYATATVEKSDVKAGGLVGGITGAGELEIKNTYATGKVTATSATPPATASVGGLIGFSDATNLTVIASYYDQDSTTLKTSAGGNTVVGVSKAANIMESKTARDPKPVGYYDTIDGTLDADGTGNDVQIFVDWDAKVWKFAEKMFPTLVAPATTAATF